jgi:hypothetical protein
MDKFIELHDNDQMWATVEHSGHIVKIIVYNDVGSMAWVIPEHVVKDLVAALNKE